MISRFPKVVVKQLPDAVTAEQWRALTTELSSMMDSDRPGVVLECSRVRQFNTPAACFLLSCLECAMKRNGDVRLAGVSAEAKASLQLTGIEGLFRIFNSTQEAEISFRRDRYETLPDPIGVDLQ